jgi:hypothetical protein
MVTLRLDMSDMGFVFCSEPEQQQQQQLNLPALNLPQAQPAPERWQIWGRFELFL